MAETLDELHRRFVNVVLEYAKEIKKLDEQVRHAETHSGIERESSERSHEERSGGDKTPASNAR